MGNSTAWNLRGRLDGSDKQLFTFQEERGSLVCVCARVALQALAISHHFPVLTLRTLHPIPLMKLWMGPMIKPVQRFERSNSAGGPRPGQPCWDLRHGEARQINAHSTPPGWSGKTVVLWLKLRVCPGLFILFSICRFKASMVCKESVKARTL